MNRALKRWLLSYAVTAVIFAVLDLVWISFVASNLYQSQIGHLIATSPNAAGAVVFYLIFVAGMVHYGVRPNDSGA
ncbi:MAG: putative rane protein, partial [Pseudarthrobacter sp.]|nr:putative rane protein [Pseudarthrobacter sp.]